MKNKFKVYKMLSIILILFGIICIIYDFALIILNPGTFLDNLTSFSHIWLLLGGYHIFLGIYRKKTGHSFWKIWKKWIKITVFSLLSFAFVFSTVSLCFILNPKTVKIEENCDYLILLGGGINKKGILPDSVLNRVDTAALYLQNHPETVCVVTGGTLKWLPFAEAPEIKNQLVKRGISPDKILVEDQALDTIQNLQFSCKILSDYTGKTQSEILDSKIVIITSNFHLRRSQRLAKRLGFTQISGIGAKCPAFYVIHNYLREILAYLKLDLRILLTGKPLKINNIL